MLAPHISSTLCNHMEIVKISLLLFKIKQSRDFLSSLTTHSLQSDSGHHTVFPNIIPHPRSYICVLSPIFISPIVATICSTNLQLNPRLVCRVKLLLLLTKLTHTINFRAEVVCRYKGEPRLYTLMNF